MLRNMEHEKILETLDRETRLVLVLVAGTLQGLNQKLDAKEVVAEACKVVSAVFPEKKE